MSSTSIELFRQHTEKQRQGAELLDNERQWFALLDTLRHVRWQGISP